MKRIFAWLWAILFCLPTAIHALGVHIVADRILVSSSPNLVEAVDQVVLKAGRLTVTSDYLRYQQRPKLVVASGNTMVRAPSQSYSIQSLVLDLGNTESEGTDLIGYVGTFRFNASTFRYQNRQLRLSDVTFTTCELATPDYQVNASTMIYYADTGLVWSINNWIRVLGVPVFWTPTLITGVGSVRQSQTGVLPQFTSNPVEGFSLRQALQYVLSSRLHGAFTLGYSQNFGWLGGLSVVYLDSHFQVNASVLGSQHGGVESGGDMSIPIRFSQLTTTNLFDQIHQNIQGELPSSTLRFGTYYRRFNNYSRVTEPFLTSIDIPNVLNLPVYLNLNQSYTSEEDLLSPHRAMSQRLQVLAHSRRDYPIWEGLNGSIGFSVDSRFYDYQRQWQRLFGIVGLHYDNGLMRVNTTFSQGIYLTPNESPFEFERRYSQQENEWGFSLAMPLLGFEVGAEGYYAVQSRAMGRLNIRVGADVHCFKAALVYQTIERQWLMEVNLTQ